MFPMSQDSHTIINCFLTEARRCGIEIRTETKIDSLDLLSGYDFIAVTTGGSPKAEGLRWLGDMGHELESPVPSLFTFQIADEALHALMGTVVEDVVTMIPGTKLRHLETIELRGPTTGRSAVSRSVGCELDQPS